MLSPKSLRAIYWLLGVCVGSAAAFGAEPGSPLASKFAHPAKSYPRDEPTLAQGQTLFTQLCASCHLLVGDTIGPPLGGVTDVLTRAELLRHIRNPAQVIADGNPRANALLRRYKAMMPPFEVLPEEQIVAILAYVDRETEVAKLKPFTIALEAAGPETRLIPPVAKSGLVIELEDFVQIPLAPNRRPDKGIATLRTSPKKDGAMFVSDQMGVIYRVKDRKVSVYLDLRDKLPDFVFEPGIGTGLGSFAFHPEFLSNGLIYTTHAEADKKQPAINDDFYEGVTLTENKLPTLHWVVSEWHATDASAERFVGTRREVLRGKMPSTTHGWGDITFAPVSDKRDPDYGLLFIGVGEGGAVNMKMPQLADQPRSLLGTLLRINPRGNNAANGQYGIPSDNPFADSPDPKVRKEIWAYGFRNPHRMCWDLTYGKRLILADIGEKNVEEVNLIEKGGNYGWNRLEGTTCIDVLKDALVVRAATPAELEGFRPPLGQYDHTDGRAISGGFVYEGPIKELQHKYIFGDIVTGRLFFMNMDATLADHTIYELNIMQDGAVTNLQTLSKVTRVHLRIGYDEQTKDLFFMTKSDGRVRRVAAAHLR
jgi:glucose/arabinose dehydrogenase/mono/diheme cytochrome c family protein